MRRLFIMYSGRLNPFVESRLFILQRFSLTRALQEFFPIGQMCFWWMSIICFYDISRTLAPSEIMKKSCAGSFNHALTICVFLTDSKIWQTLNYYLKSTKTNRSAKVLFSEWSMALQMHSKHLKIRNANLF